MRQLVQITWANRVKVREVAGIDLCEASPLWFDGPEPAQFTDIFQTPSGPFLAQMDDWLYRNDAGLFVLPNDEFFRRVNMHKKLIVVLNASMASCCEHKGLNSCDQCNAPECYPRDVQKEIIHG